MNWNDIAARIEEMTPEQRDKSALLIDNNTGELTQVESIDPAVHHVSPAPVDHFVISGSEGEEYNEC
jgi:hypothetical protein